MALAVAIMAVPDPLITVPITGLTAPATTIPVGKSAPTSPSAKSLLMGLPVTTVPLSWSPGALLWTITPGTQLLVALLLP